MFDSKVPRLDLERGRGDEERNFKTEEDKQFEYKIKKNKKERRRNVQSFLLPFFQLYISTLKKFREQLRHKILIEGSIPVIKWISYDWCDWTAFEGMNAKGSVKIVSKLFSDDYIITKHRNVVVGYTQRTEFVIVIETLM